MVANLVANAVRFSPPGGRVEVWGRRVDGRAVLEVCDQGPGIPADQRDRVFQRFARADPGRPAVGSGAGLGLAIVAEIVQLHGGTVRAEPVSPTGAAWSSPSRRQPRDREPPLPAHPPAPPAAPAAAGARHPGWPVSHPRWFPGRATAGTVRTCRGRRGPRPAGPPAGGS